MYLFTIGYAKKDARTFFDLIKSNRIDTLIDIRLYNSSQLAGFTKSRDLKYFLEVICDCGYIWAKQFAPTPELLAGYKDGKIKWDEYERIYNKALDVRGDFDFFEDCIGKKICLLCAEATPERCHRRLLAEKIENKYPGTPIVHL